jgi:hypothetical protein
VPLLLLGPPFFPIILFWFTALLTRMTSISLHKQWSLTSQSHGSVSQREQLFFSLWIKLHAKLEIFCWRFKVLLILFSNFSRLQISVVYFNERLVYLLIQTNDFSRDPEFAIFRNLLWITFQLNIKSRVAKIGRIFAWWATVYFGQFSITKVAHIRQFCNQIWTHCLSATTYVLFKFLQVSEYGPRSRITKLPM